MIKLEKTTIPDILVQNGNKWTKTIIDKLTNNEEITHAEKTKYRNQEIKKALIAETKGKCAYCESKLQHIHHGDVEHIYPKSLAPEKTFEWDNLTIACEVCNQNKSNKDPNLDYIIDPYQVDPNLHLRFLGSLVFHRGTELGINTEAILQLNRAALCEQRKEKLEKVMSIFTIILNKNLSLASRKAIYENLLFTEASPEASYTAMTASAISQMENDLPAEFFS